MGYRSSRMSNTTNLIASSHDIDDRLGTVLAHVQQYKPLGVSSQRHSIHGR